MSIISEIQTLHNTDDWKKQAVKECIEFMINSKQVDNKELVIWKDNFEKTFNEKF